MGHMAGKDLYRKLGKKIDGLTARAPWNETFYNILKELYTPREAELIVKMPYGLANVDGIAKITGFEKDEAQKLLESLADKGLVIDIYTGEKYLYTISPMVIGIFEFTMMRTRGELNMKEWARMFHEYLSNDDAFYRANMGKGQKMSPLRVLPWEETVDDDSFVEILDYEKASSIIENGTKFAIGICSCRHEKLHTGEKRCDIPLETCSTFDFATESMIRHGFAEEVSREEMQENLARSKEMGLVLCADNVQKNVSFICHCCGCCCNVLSGISRFGYPNVVVTSNYIARIDSDECIQCGDCVEDCPIGAISVNGEGDTPVVDESLCLGCGVCALDCSSGSLKLYARESRVFYPSDTFERVILQSLEQGTLQNLLFNNPQSRRHGFMRGFVGGFLKLPPVKKALMSDSLRSRFLGALRKGA
jgi:NAD-dependent dihydropyrimidine dehydrogenase PreA subunit